MNEPTVGLEVPDLADDRIRLRMWLADDAAALAAAWHDPGIAARSSPPTDRSREAAARWIEGCETARRAGLALDLAIADIDDAVIGEVGLSRIDPRRRVAMIGWWVDAAHRGQGVASAAVALVADWALHPDRLCALVAEIAVDNVDSTRVARRAGFVLLRAGTPDTPTVWTRRAHGREAGRASGTLRPRP